MINKNFYKILLGSMNKHQDRVAIEWGEKRYFKYSDLIKSTSQYAETLLQTGVKPGDRVIVQIQKSPQALILYLACLSAGLVYVPLNTAYGDRELKFFLENAMPKVVIADQTTDEKIRGVAGDKSNIKVISIDEISKSGADATRFSAVAYRESSDLAVLIYTSGTTGQPKGAMLTHGNIANNAEILAKTWLFDESDILLHALPIFHIHGLFVANHSALITGAKIIWINKFSTTEVIQNFVKATIFMGVPTYYSRLLDDAALNMDKCKNIRLFISGSAPLTEKLQIDFLERSGKKIIERYGMSEAGIITATPPGSKDSFGTVGICLENYQLRIVDDNNIELGEGEVGEIQIKGPSLFNGYWRSPQKTESEFTADKWFKTGDIGYLDKKQYLSIVGRAKDMIITGGYNVYPKEVEYLIQEVSDVSEVAVVGVPHHDFGEAVVAVIVPSGDKAIDKNEIRSTLKTQLANYKIPKYIFSASELPRNAMGKIQKNIIRENLINAPEISSSIAKN